MSIDSTRGEVPADRGHLAELGFYLLPGDGQPETLLEEARQGERLGLGTGFLSERWAVKEVASLSGAACAATSRMTIATAATNHNMRHPLVTASWATTLHRMTGGRFSLGIGRGMDARWRAMGMKPLTTREMGEFARTMRALWHGESIDVDGEAGHLHGMRLDSRFDEDIELGLVAFGPKSLELGGQAFDWVVLHTFFTEETLQRCVATVKRSAERAGRDPDAVKVWSCLATIGDHLPESDRLRKTVGRMATYLQAYGDLMVATNNWDPAVLAAFRGDPLVQSFRAPIDAVATHDQVEQLAGLIPDAWLEPAATGSPEQCAARVRRELELGADGVILHGATPAELVPIVTAYR